MGVPSFYRWLVEKYPKIVCDIATNDHSQKKGPNRQDLEFHNLYLDMNGIIYSCFQPDHNNLNPPTTFEEVFENIYEYVDKLFDIVRPRELLFLAIDGVAPRAKMNQQRARRFKTAKDNELYEEVEKKFREEFEKKGKKVSPKEQTEVADSNIITPGTKFMHMLSEKLQSYIKLKMSNDPHWKTIQVVLSDANVPGEGEHKIMSYIRAQRCSEGYNPNTRHCLYGLDVDLIILALATHEVHFSVLREVVGKQDPTPVSHHQEQTSGPGRSNRNEEHITPAKNTRFEFLKIWLLREYLEFDMQISDTPENVKKIELERIIDDFIFICFFAGNDFLPHMPTLETHEGGIDLLMHVYKNEFKNLGGYLVDIQKIAEKKNAYVKLKRVEKFILSVGKFEDKIFKKRSEIFERKMRRILSQQSKDVGDEDNAFHGEKECETDISEVLLETENNQLDQVLSNTEELKHKVKYHIRSLSDTFKSGAFSDKVKLGSHGFKERYYQQKFSANSPEDRDHTRKQLVQKYTEGLLWVLKYYYSGVPSWNWFYPFHYGPFASDLAGLAQVKIEFQKGLPFKPCDQLLAVLPPNSAHALPDAYQKLMVDEKFGIAHFYPTDFEIDSDGIRFLWKAVCKLPFIEENLLLKATKEAEKELKEHEKARNAETHDRLFVGMSSCFAHNLPVGCNSKHHLLEGVIIPEKTITEADVLEKQLWHESSGYNVQRIGWWGSRGRGNFQDSTLPKRRSWWPNAQTSGTNVSSSDSASGFNLRFEKQCSLSSSDHNRNRWKGTFRGSSSLKSYSEVKEQPDVIHRDAGVGWGRRRGRTDGSRPLGSPGSNLSSRIDSSRLQWSPSEQSRNGSEGSYPKYDARTASSAGSWGNRATSSAGSGRWIPNSPNSSPSEGQQSYGRGQYVHKTTSSWNSTQSRQRNHFQ